MIKKNNIFFLNCVLLFQSNSCQQNNELTLAIADKYGCISQADYVVVGVGTAGGLMAKALSDDLKTSVIALHIGENLTQDPLIKFSRNAILTVLSALAGSSILYKTGLTIPQSEAFNRMLMWALALPEGGASSINAGAYCRETNEINAQWEAIAGPAWSINRITNLYKQLETYNGQTTNPAVRGFKGPIDVRQVPASEVTTVAQKFTQAVINATGFPFVLDYNDPNTPIGASSQFQYTQSGPNGLLRVSSATAFLNDTVVTPSGKGVNGRKLTIVFNANALRTIWSENTAIGVEFLQNNILQTASAKKGIIICAGLNSSPFLLRSGIGPKALLDSLNIPVKFNNPNVGNGLADHPRVNLIFTSNPNDSSSPVFSNNNLFSQISYLPDPTGDQTIRKLRLSTINPIPGITAGLFDLIQPLSRGTITINSSDSLKPPVVNLGVLSNSQDLQLFKRGLQIYIKNINIALQAIDPTYKLIFPDPAILSDDNAVINFIKESVASNQHFQSHCRMAPFNQGGVVDSSGRVYGVRNLIVADDSIVPLCMDGSPMASAYLMAANIARMLTS